MDTRTFKFGIDQEEFYLKSVNETLKPKKVCCHSMFILCIFRDNFFYEKAANKQREHRDVYRRLWTSVIPEELHCQPLEPLV